MERSHPCQQLNTVCLNLMIPLQTFLTFLYVCWLFVLYIMRQLHQNNVLPVANTSKVRLTSNFATPIWQDTVNYPCVQEKLFWAFTANIIIIISIYYTPCIQAKYLLKGTTNVNTMCTWILWFPLTQPGCVTKGRHNEVYILRIPTVSLRRISIKHPS